MSKVIINHYQRRYWQVAEIFKDGTLIAKANKFYQVTPDWIFIYDEIGGSGYGYKKGELLKKIFVGDCEIEKLLKNEA